MLKNIKKLDEQIKKGDFREIAVVQLLIDSLGELLQVVIRQLQIEEGKEPTEAQKAFLSGLKSNIVAFKNLKRQLEEMTESDFFGVLSAQPPGGDPFSETRPKNLDANEFYLSSVNENKKDKHKENQRSNDDVLGL
jgi:hypothetical protein